MSDPVSGQPDQTRRSKTVANLCRYIDAAETVPTSEELAAVAGCSVDQVHRLFKDLVGLSPRAYASTKRTERVRLDLKRSVSGQPIPSGLGRPREAKRSARIYEQSQQVPGMKPEHHSVGNDDIRFAVGRCFLGSILVAKSSKGICAILLGDSADELVQDLEDRYPGARFVGGDPAFDAIVVQVVALMEAPERALNLPLDIQGTAFQQRVWAALRQVPPGETVSYTQVAKRIGAPNSVRAVAGACAANALAVAIPCHRVLRSDGALSGYRWGIERKAALLKQEAEA